MRTLLKMVGVMVVLAYIAVLVVLWGQWLWFTVTLICAPVAGFVALLVASSVPGLAEPAGDALCMLLGQDCVSCKTPPTPPNPDELKRQDQ
jgi:hypothetical protein